VHFADMPPRVLAVTTGITARRQAEYRLRMALADLRVRHALLAAALASTDNLVFVKDCGGHYLLINEAGARLHGKPTAQFIGRTDEQFNDRDSQPWAAQQRQRVLNGRGPVGVAVRLGG
jgi:PAS domain-containing protein